MRSLGVNLLVDFYDCNLRTIDQLNELEEILLESARISGATIIKSVFHQFSPQGVSGVVVIAESHFAIHTWPEFGYCAIDIFTCSEDMDTNKAIHFLREKLGAKTVSISETKRGLLDYNTDQYKLNKT